LSEFRTMISNLSAMVEYLSVTELTEKLLELTEYRLELQRENTLESKSRLENIEEFLSVTQEFEKRNEDKSLIAFLTELALIADIDSMDDEEEDGDAVILMTMHSAKGLEFPIVFIVGMEEGLFPSSRAFMENAEMEEERRLAYVGITRAEKKLYLTCARMRLLYGKTSNNAPSRFLEEIPRELKEAVETAGGRSTGSYGGYGSRISGGSTGGSYGGGNRFASGSASGGGGNSPVGFGARPTVSGNTGASVIRPQTPSAAKPAGEGMAVAAGDKVEHAKWGIGTVVAVKGTGNDAELQIAFPAPIGVKRLLAAFAPVTKI
jgi:DNA helicase-2/ATP-dependent DNA helicase PcrA